jgi:hypothetical protein
MPTRPRDRRCADLAANEPKGSPRATPPIVEGLRGPKKGALVLNKIDGMKRAELLAAGRAFERRKACSRMCSWSPR